MYHQILTENIIYRQFMSFIQLIRYFEMKSMNTGYDQTIKKKDSKMFLFKNMFVFIMQYYCTFTLEGFLILRGTVCLLIEFLEKGNYMYLQKFTDIFVQHLRRVTIQRLWRAKDPLHYFDQFLLLILSDAFFILKVRQKEASLVLNLGQKLITLRIDFAPFSIYLLLN